MEAKAYQDIVESIRKQGMELPVEQAHQINLKLGEITQSEYDPAWLAKNLIEIYLLFKEYPEAADRLYQSLESKFAAMEAILLSDSDEQHKRYQATLGSADAPLNYPLYVCPKDPTHEFDYKRSPRQVMTCPNHGDCAMLPALKLLKLKV